MTAALPQPGILFTLVSFALVIGVLVTVHEFGHYLMGRYFGVRADAFSIGFGPELAGWTDRRGTRWRLSLLPLGGYVKFAGDANAASAGSVGPAAPDTLAGRPVWQRAAIIAAGPLINFAFAIVLLAGLFMALGRPVTPAVVAGVETGSAAAAAGVRAGDRIVAWAGAPVRSFEDLRLRIAMDVSGDTVPFVVERGDARVALVARPRVIETRDGFGNAAKIGLLGVRPARTTEYTAQTPLAAVVAATGVTLRAIPAMIDGIGQVARGDRAFSEMAGPVKMVQLTGQQASLGAANLVQFVALISINLGFINLLPIPVLDGGHLLLYAVEGIRRRPLSARAQELAFMSGFAALFTFMVAKTLNDLGTFGFFQRLTGLAG